MMFGAKQEADEMECRADVNVNVNVNANVRSCTASSGRRAGVIQQRERVENTLERA